jgi:hypothetical protein
MRGVAPSLPERPGAGKGRDGTNGLGRRGAAVYALDLSRPESAERAREIVETAARNEAPILRSDFFNSLLAAFTPDEIRVQLRAAGLGPLDCRVVSERHWLVRGRL